VFKQIKFFAPFAFFAAKNNLRLLAWGRVAAGGLLWCRESRYEYSIRQKRGG